MQRPVRVAASVLLAATAAIAQEQEPFRIDRAIGGPEWVKFSGLQRTRFESLHGQFRTGNRERNDDQWFTRTSLRADFDFDGPGGTLEIMDSRAFGGGPTSLASTALVNTTDIVNGFVSYAFDAPKGESSRLLAGRYTMSVGSRRWIIRNGYRNTVNTFTGVDYLWSNDEGEQLQLFWTMPVRRRPFDGPSLRDNDFEWDDQSLDLQFFGAFGRHRLDDRDLLELYVFGLYEDGAGSNNRKLTTPGVRLLRPQKRGDWFGEAEGTLQFGRSQASSAAAAPTLDHFAYFVHASIGYAWDCLWQPAVRLAYDYASGDSDPTDGDNGRMDRLFGAPRFEYGPTGLWSAVQRSNLSSPELRVTCRPTDASSVMVAVRDVRLATARDQWVGSGVVDATGGSGEHVGLQYELRARYDLLPGNLQLELGGAYLVAGGFLESAPNSVSGGDSRYAYVQMNWKF